MARARVLIKESIVLIKKKHELAPLLKKIQKGSLQAVDILIKSMLNPTTEEEAKVEIAKTLINYESKLTEQINKEAVQMRELESKIAVSGVPGKLVQGGKKSSGPMIDFSNITDV